MRHLPELKAAWSTVTQGTGELEQATKHQPNPFSTNDKCFWQHNKLVNKTESIKKLNCSIEQLHESPYNFLKNKTNQLKTSDNEGL